MFRPEYHRLSGTSFAALIRLHCLDLDLIEFLGTSLDLSQRIRLCRRQANRQKLLGGRFKATLGFLISLEGQEVALLSTHHVEPRVIASDLRSERKLLRKGIKLQVFFDCDPLIDGATD
ncbi:hypothetical protein [Agrobacterium sp. Ap1]|uniref:hypothetical protein n=1 Tax=Agrobacterium sp. Ap1 TaxID=2815337 RepID=UPI00336BE6CF